MTEDELPALVRALVGLSANPGATLAIRLAALTGLRIGEAQTMRWDDLDLRNGILTLPKAKTGRRLHTLRSAPLTLLAETQAHIQGGLCRGGDRGRATSRPSPDGDDPSRSHARWHAPPPRHAGPQDHRYG